MHILIFKIKNKTSRTIILYWRRLFRELKIILPLGLLMVLIFNLYVFSEVLIHSPKKLSAAEIKKVQDIKSQIIYWQKIAGELPGYRDAYLKLAVLNYDIGRNFDAKKFLDTALEIDPNSSQAATLSSLPL
ncbi:MAG: hypothetical protein M1484_01065 [Patescibacteria group bacterium]|nr:hypothetical protein [Patescibacteria group bacterium]MCL5431670.1 hypothetical protein [Patescibacteria group bacterium]